MDIRIQKKMTVLENLQNSWEFPNGNSRWPWLVSADSNKVSAYWQLTVSLLVVTLLPAAKAAEKIC